MAVDASETYRVVIESDGWELVGDLHVPDTDERSAAVLMLNQAAGDRKAYDDLSAQLVARGMVAQQLDLPGHGDSTNRGSFIPGEVPRSPLIWDAETSVAAAHQFLKDHDRIDASNIAIVAASYSGEEAAESGRVYGYAQAYVVLSPGSFSNESIVAMDESGLPWLFVASKDERFLQEITAEVQRASKTAETVILPGSAHASDLLAEHPDLAMRITAWLQQVLSL